MMRLIQGYRRFQSEVYSEHQATFARLTTGQNPEALFITCADSRVNPTLITQSDVGDIFVCRNVGNLVPPHGEHTGGVSSAIEYAVVALDVRHIVVLGHSDCGAMKALLDPDRVAGMPAVSTWLQHAQTASHVVTENFPELRGADRLRKITEENVLAQMDHLRTHPSVQARLRRGVLRLHGWYYDIACGLIFAWDSEQNTFLPLHQAEDSEPAALVEAL